MCLCSFFLMQICILPLHLQNSISQWQSSGGRWGMGTSTKAKWSAYPWEDVPVESPLAR